MIPVAEGFLSPMGVTGAGGSGIDVYTSSRYTTLCPPRLRHVRGVSAVSALSTHEGMRRGAGVA